jgi:CDK inhibitor PHO81
LYQVSFNINVISPFEGVTLGIGGAVETYWKSLAMASTPPIPKRVISSLSRPRPIASAQASAQASPAGSTVVAPTAQAITVSSIVGNHVYLTVQVTRDLRPVVFSDWRLPEASFDLGVADVTLRQFEALATRTGRNLRISEGLPSSAADWHKQGSFAMASLETFMKVQFPTRRVNLCC